MPSSSPARALKSRPSSRPARPLPCPSFPKAATPVTAAARRRTRAARRGRDRAGPAEPDPRSRCRQFDDHGRSGLVRSPRYRMRPRRREGFSRCRWRLKAAARSAAICRRTPGASTCFVTAPRANSCWVSKWVLPDGEVWSSLRGLRKDNTGYDLKQLFLGAEGTLGLITAAVLKLFPAPRSRSLAWVALPDLRCGGSAARRHPFCGRRAAQRLRTDQPQDSGVGAGPLRRRPRSARPAFAVVRADRTRGQLRGGRAGADLRERARRRDRDANSPAMR